MNPYSDNSRTFEEKERDWHDVMRALQLAMHGPRLLVPALSDSRLQDPSKPSSGYSYCATVGDLMKNSTIYGHCVPCWKDWVLDGTMLLAEYGDCVWGPETTIKHICPHCKKKTIKVFVSYSGLPHGEVSGRLIGVKI